MPKKLIEVDEKVPLKLTAAERKLVLDELMCLDQDFEETIRATPAGEPVMMTLDDLDDFAGFVAAEANHCDDKKKEKKLDTVFQKVQGLLDRYSDEEPPQTVKFEDAHKNEGSLRPGRGNRPVGGSGARGCRAAADQDAAS